jgi:hypothetical protein
MLAVTFVGGAVVLRIAFAGADTLRAVKPHQANEMMLNPDMSAALMDELDAAQARGRSYDLSSLYSILVSDSAMLTRFCEWIEAAFPSVEITTEHGAHLGAARMLHRDSNGRGSQCRRRGR